MSPRRRSDDACWRTDARGRVLLGTVAGDIHDIGKNLAEQAFRISGFTVEDLGVNVPPQDFFEAAQRFKPDIVGLSGLLTVAFTSMRDTVALFRSRADELEKMPHHHHRRRHDRRARRRVRRRRPLDHRRHGGRPPVRADAGEQEGEGMSDTPRGIGHRREQQVRLDLHRRAPPAGGLPHDGPRGRAGSRHLRAHPVPRPAPRRRRRAAASAWWRSARRTWCRPARPP